MEKFEGHSDVGFAVVLFTPDDVGYPAGQAEVAKPRARQNVVLELGFFLQRSVANACAFSIRAE